MQVVQGGNTFQKILIVNSTEEAIRILLEEYKKSEVTIGEMLANINITGLSVEQVVEVYARLYNLIEGDEVYRMDENGLQYTI